ncbi:hypothetical protein PROFUN_04404 [Planoprotostelium fungivorum]|uniref:Uncharacterized protein n=1 Tax=Planoprotostelium fungivorum TaxID=1890364 RepID=A0A2P6NHU5_9EUKA|nr:hypothetical protein PROFUN_04404 [Planoprotostelium fungivorum]
MTQRYTAAQRPKGVKQIPRSYSDLRAGILSFGKKSPPKCQQGGSSPPLYVLEIIVATKNSAMQSFVVIALLSLLASSRAAVLVVTTYSTSSCTNPIQTTSYPTGCQGSGQNSLQTLFDGITADFTATYKVFSNSGSCEGNASYTRTYELDTCTRDPPGGSTYYKAYFGPWIFPPPGPNDQITEYYLSSTCGGVAHAFITYGTGCTTSFCSAAKTSEFFSRGVCLAQGQTYNAQQGTEFAVDSLFQLLSFQTPSANDVRSPSHVKEGNTITSYGTAVLESGSTPLNDVCFQSSPNGIIWGVFDVNGNRDSATNFLFSRIAAAFNPTAVVYYIDQNRNNVYDKGEELQSPTQTSSLYHATDSEGTFVIGGFVQVNAQLSGTLNFRYTVANKPYINQGVTVKDDTTMIDIQINPVYPDYASSNTRVALIASLGVLQTSSSFNGAVNSGRASFNGNAGITFSNNGQSGGLSWAGSASMNSSSGVSSSANVAAFASPSPSYANVRELVFNFQGDKPASIYWHTQFGGSPQLDISSQLGGSPHSGTSSQLVAPLVTVLSFVVMTVLASF